MKESIEILKEFDNQVIDYDLLEEIWENECVDKVVDLGKSSSHKGCYWVSVEFVDGSSIDVFVREEK